MNNRPHKRTRRGGLATKTKWCDLDIGDGDILGVIFRYLDVRDLLRVQRTNQRLHLFITVTIARLLPDYWQKHQFSTSSYRFLLFAPINFREWQVLLIQATSPATGEAALIVNVKLHDLPYTPRLPHFVQRALMSMAPTYSADTFIQLYEFVYCHNIARVRNVYYHLFVC